MPGDSREKNTPGLKVFYAILGSVFFADQLTKWLAVRFLSPFDTLPVIPDVFHFTLVHNTGIAFGFFRQHPGLLLLLISFSLVFIFIWSHKKDHWAPIQRFCLAAILGGALGNWVDRVRVGAVIDFLDFRVWPVFNIADCAITIGVSLFVVSLLRKQSK